MHFNLSEQKQYLQQGTELGQAQSLKAHKCSTVTPIFTISAHFGVHLCEAAAGQMDFLYYSMLVDPNLLKVVTPQPHPVQPSC